MERLSCGLHPLYGLMILLIVSSCGGGSSPPPTSSIEQDIDAILALDGAQGETGTPSANSIAFNVTETTIHSITVTGTSDKIGDVTPINPSENGGDFSIDWHVTSSDPYHVDVYLRVDDTISKQQGDIRVFQQNCGSVSQLYRCDQFASFACHFNSTNEFYCGTLSPANAIRNLTTFLSAIPMDANLIFKACNSVLSNCREAVVPVQFQ